MRRFEMGQQKFWEVEVRGKDLVVRFGKLGTQGQTKLKKLGSPEAAQKEADKLVREKQGKGYVEASASLSRARERVGVRGKSAGSPVADAWARIEAWFAKRPQFPLGLRPGVNPKDLAAAEKTLGVRLPEDFRQSLLIHDGQERGCQVVWLPHALQLGSLAELVACWKDDRKYFDEAGMKERLDWLEKSQRVRQVHLHPKHIPFAGSQYWDYGRLLLDYIPGPKGVEAQVIARDDIDFVPVAANYTEFLERVATGLERGKIKVHNND